MRGFTVIVLGQKGTETQEKIQDFEMEAAWGNWKSYAVIYQIKIRNIWNKGSNLAESEEWSSQLIFQFK